MSSLTPQQQAWLDMIAYAEGTDRNKSRGGYNILFGGGRFSDLTRHPDKVVKAPGIASAAAGRYQFMPDTWKAVSTALKLPDFSPAAWLGRVHLRCCSDGDDQRCPDHD